MADQKAQLNALLEQATAITTQATAMLAVLRPLQAAAPAARPAAAGSSGGWGPGSARPFAGPPQSEQKPFVPEKGMEDPSANATFPLNIRKQYREGQVEWQKTFATVLEKTGVEFKFFCNFEAWQEAKGLNTKQKETTGKIIAAIIKAWGDGFIEFAKDPECLEAFKEAYTSGNFFLRIAWDPALQHKQGGGSNQILYDNGSLVVNVKPESMYVNLVELTNKDRHIASL